VTDDIAIVDIDLETADAEWPPAGEPLQGALVIARSDGVPIGSRLFLEPPPSSAHELRHALGMRPSALPTAPETPVSITVAVCTRDRPALLDRCLRSVVTAVEVAGQEVVADVVVADNASADDATRDVAESHGARCVREPVPGLDVARNRAVAASASDVIAFVDDDVVVDRTWLRTLARTFAANPGVGTVTGGVLAMRLDTPARVEFERLGGFSLGWLPTRFSRDGDDLVLRPDIGVGCNMAFRTATLAAIGPFDEALDTGRPLPGGGDLDILIRGCDAAPVLYEPAALVFHEHRESWKGLRYQYYTWGLSWAVVLAKWHGDDRHRSQVRANALRTMRGYARDLLRGPRRTKSYRRSHCAVMAIGFAAGLAGSYRRSQARMRARHQAARTDVWQRPP
jgi:glycosyltransferase involved in cell wall biosynthesis